MTNQFRHVFIDSVPDAPEPGVIYVSLAYATAVHLCACGCGLEVVTPLAPTDWQIAYDGETLSLVGGDDAASRAGSVGNWSFPCRSHYLIRRSRVQWRQAWTAEQVAAGRSRDRAAKQQRHESAAAPVEVKTGGGRLMSRLHRAWRGGRPPRNH